MTPSNAQLAMQVLLAAGQAKQALLHAIAAHQHGQTLNLQPGHHHLVTAHQAQNQLTARLADQQQSPDVLTCHAMDTLMAVESNYELVQALLSDSSAR
ncbi:PTS lactose/cellobiose transporter subunit IIA [Levilactobacillus zymae]|nr:PTS lactose/cellobiose transporter subunit IIA [Levilactobacillus zymae]